MVNWRSGTWTLIATSLVTAMMTAPIHASAAEPHAELRLRVVSPNSARHPAPAVVWLEPLAGTTALPFQSQDSYTLLQKNRMFIPHLQVIPVGSVLHFPNADPFFHNVFSVFDGKRFDLGLYEAGSSKTVTFSREGISYIFCNIHPEMSAVVISLSTPLYAIAEPDGSLLVHNIPPGDYQMSLWIEGVPPSRLGELSRRLHLTARTLDLGEVAAPATNTKTHMNEFGKPYDPLPKPPY